jgi:methyltransferase (TIGR00027 family)
MEGRHATMTEARVETPHSFTGRMCAASRAEESRRSDALFSDRIADKLAGREGRAAPMGAWILVPRTRFGDDLLAEAYERNGARQLVLLGAGFDARAWRVPLPDLRVFEVDQPTTFNVKEPLVKNEALTVAERRAVPADFTVRGAWSRSLKAAGFDPAVPTVWLLEGLLMYLSASDTQDLMQDVGALSAPGSVVFHDACSAGYLNAGVVVGGAPFIGGSDQYAALWRRVGFDAFVHDFRAIYVDRRERRLGIDRSYPEATPEACRGRNLVLFVTGTKAQRTDL